MDKYTRIKSSRRHKVKIKKKPPECKVKRKNVGSLVLVHFHINWGSTVFRLCSRCTECTSYMRNKICTYPLPARSNFVSAFEASKNSGLKSILVWCQHLEGFRINVCGKVKIPLRIQTVLLQDPCKFCTGTM